MLTVIHQLFDTTALQGLNDWLDAANWADGRVTAGEVAAAVKRNEQVAEQSAGLAEQRQLVLGLLARHAVFQAATLPLRMNPPLFAQYRDGMSYGEHTDNALMMNGTLRADLAYTIFLSDPNSYDGGELMISSDHTPVTVKLAAGGLVAYSAATLHRVNPVTRGLRRVAVGWLQSHVRDPAQRTLLFDMARAIARMRELEPGGEAVRLLEKSRQNLLRMWA